VENSNQVVYRIGCWYQTFVVQYQMSSISYWGIFHISAPLTHVVLYGLRLAHNSEKTVA